MVTSEDFMHYFKPVPKTGVIYVLEKACEMGYSPEKKEWANLGQGAPETGPINGDTIERKINIDFQNSEYAPVSGKLELRQKIADYYNTLYRKESLSKYTYKNVCVAGGGRIALSRLVAALGNINLGHFIPDYTAYEELLGAFKTFVPIPILLDPKKQYKIPIEELKEEIIGRGLSALLISNPCNPTGQHLKQDELKQWVTLGKELKCMMIFDEFYSHYIYDKQQTHLLSAAEHITDVNKDPMVIINGLSKNWRSPGWRLGWVVASEEIIERVSSVGSFLDGGAVHPLQNEAIALIKPEKTQHEAALIQSVFIKKRDYALKRLKKMGLVIDVAPDSTFYIWCDISQLPTPLNQCETFFQECLKERVITVPGIFFDVNPGKRRLKQHSRYSNYVRISFGPSMDSLKTGLDSIERTIKKHQT